MHSKAMSNNFLGFVSTGLFDLMSASLLYSDTQYERIWYQINFSVQKI